MKLTWCEEDEVEDGEYEEQGDKRSEYEEGEPRRLVRNERGDWRPSTQTPRS